MDPETPLAETIGAFDELVAEGKIRAYGGSNVDSAWLEEALEHGRPDWVQNSYSLLDRDDEDGVLAVCAREGLGYTPFSPLAGGWLTGQVPARRAAAGRLADDDAPRAVPPPAGGPSLRRAGGLRGRGARARTTTPAALALAWLLAHPQVTAVVVGPRRPEHLEPALEALELRLSPPEHEALGRLFA